MKYVTRKKKANDYDLRLSKDTIFCLSENTVASNCNGVNDSRPLISVLVRIGH